MQVLLLSAYPDSHCDADVVELTKQTLQAQGNTVTHLDLEAMGFDPFISEAEMKAYTEKDNLITEHTRNAAMEISRSDAIVFCYPTRLRTVPPRIKGFLDRVLVPGVAFKFTRSKRFLRPGMGNIRRIATVTTTPKDRLSRKDDLGFNTLFRGLRINCGPFVRGTRVSAPTGELSQAQLVSSFSKWR